MDTSEKYILMCEKAEEVQEAWKPDKGDFFILGIINTRSKHFAISILGCHWAECESCRTEVDDLRDECTWLPRQDQLQEMVYHEAVEPWLILDDIHSTITPFSTETEVPISIKSQYAKFTSMEQLWLAFVMHEKYQKRWSEKDNEWISI